MANCESVSLLCNSLQFATFCSLPCSSVHGISQAKILEWVVIPFSRGSPQPRDLTSLSCTAGDFLLLSHQASPMKVKAAQSCLTLGPHGLYSPWNFPGQNTGVGSLSLLQGIFPTQGSNPGFPLQADSLPAEPQGKPKNTGVGSLSLLQWVFLTHELDRGLLHCRQILYQLSY